MLFGLVRSGGRRQRKQLRLQESNRHKLNEPQLAARIQMSNELLGIERSDKHQGWKFLLKLDES
jgi:hypothetical protein